MVAGRASHGVGLSLLGSRPIPPVMDLRSLSKAGTSPRRGEDPTSWFVTGRRAHLPRARVPTVDLDQARAFMREHHRAVLATRPVGGGIQQSPVLVNVDGEGRAIISSRETAYKVRNLRHDPWAQACVVTDGFFG